MNFHALDDVANRTFSGPHHFDNAKSGRVSEGME